MEVSNAIDALNQAKDIAYDGNTYGTIKAELIASSVAISFHQAGKDTKQALIGKDQFIEIFNTLKKQNPTLDNNNGNVTFKV